MGNKPSRGKGVWKLLKKMDLPILGRSDAPIEKGGKLEKKEEREAAAEGRKEPGHRVAKANMS